MTDPQPDRSDPKTHRRLTSLEEAAMFHEQATGDAREAAEEALRRVLAIEKRLAAMEERLGSLVQADPELPEHEKPPHSAG
ncbi:hypothetical protein AY599_18835 [Leptolyngbya valderiana BDU 20041]|nr:hypothetical protein AY599_18835 [Leptolyngbya valderiana BDU 20041]